MGFIDDIKALAAKNPKKIVLAETGDLRTLKAATQVLKEGFAKIILLGDEGEIKKRAGGLNLSGAEFVSAADSALLEKFIALFVELRGAKGMSAESARDLLINDPLYFGAAMVKSGLADGMVAGAVNATSAVLRAALQIVGKAPNTEIVSSFFVMILPESKSDFGHNGALIFSDCGLVQNPSPSELAAIAISSAKSFEALFGAPAKVALLSHSTKGSAAHADVSKVTQALEIAQKSAPELLIDGEFQLDAAIVPSVAKSKVRDSKIAGAANVLIFPDLDAGNIGYKLVQRLAGAEAYGPITQGIAAPVNDLSRGCSSEDIVGVVALTALQAK